MSYRTMQNSERFGYKKLFKIDKKNDYEAASG